MGQNIIVNVSKLLKPLFLDLYFQYCKYSHASKLFVYLYLVGQVFHAKLNDLDLQPT